MSLSSVTFQQFLAFALLLILLYRYTGVVVCLTIMAAGASLWHFCYGEPLPALLVLFMIGSALGVLCHRVERYRTVQKVSRFYH